MLRNPSISESSPAYGLLRKILHGKVRPGERLVERESKERLDLSRSHLREAISAGAFRNGLEFVTRTRNAGAEVVDLDDTDMQELMQLRQWIEPHAVVQAARTMSALGADPARADEVAAIDQQYENLRDEMDRVLVLKHRTDDETATFLDLDRMFHEFILSLSTAPDRGRRIVGFFQMLAVFKIGHAMVAEHGETIREEHDKIWQAVRSGRAQDAKELMDGHLSRCRERFQKKPFRGQYVAQALATRFSTPVLAEDGAAVGGS